MGFQGPFLLVYKQVKVRIASKLFLVVKQMHFLAKVLYNTKD